LPKDLMIVDWGKFGLPALSVGLQLEIALTKTMPIVQT